MSELQDEGNPTQDTFVAPVTKTAMQTEPLVTPTEPVVQESAAPEPVIQSPVIDDSTIALQDEPVATKEEEGKETTDNSQRKGHRALQEFDINAKEALDTGDELILPANYDKETRRILEKLPNVQILDNPDSRDWAQAVAQGIGLSTFAETFIPTLEDEQAEFKQQLAHNNISMAASVPKHKAISNENLKGERAVIRMITHLGLGTLFQVPLWHSGFWITFKPPTESEILEINRLLVSDKIQFGRDSYGLAFSNVTAYTTDRLVGFALAHVYDLTTKSEDINIDNVRQHISSQDIPSLIWGFICTMYPRGFKYRRACVADPSACNFILEETLNVMKLQWSNGVALTEWQKTHMSARQSKQKDLTSVVRYKEELTRIQHTKIDINKDKPNAISITIKTPSVSDYINAGHRWIGDIVSTVNSALAADTKDNERNSLVVSYGQASAMRQYSHWIESIEYESNTINDLETIEKLLDTLSSDDEVRKSFTDAVIDYINKSTIAVIGIPVFDCPQCGKLNNGPLKLPAYKNIIPLDVMQVFFSLLTQRLERIAER